MESLVQLASCLDSIVMMMLFCSPYGTFIHDMQLARRLGRHRAWPPGKWLWRSCSTWRLNSNKESQPELQGADANWGFLGSNGKGFTKTSE